MRTSDQTDKIYAALIASQKKMGKVSKDSKNPFFGSSYASLAKVLDVIKPVFQDNGIAIIQGSGIGHNGGINIVTRLIHESGQWIETDFPAPLSKQDAQSAGSAATYGRRYGLKAIASLAEEDDDGQAASEQDPRADRSDDSLKEITDSQLKTILHLFAQVAATPENIAATCAKYSGDRTEDPEALMKSEASRLIPKLRTKLKEQATV